MKNTGIKKYRIVLTSAVQTFLQYRLNLALFAIGHIIVITTIYFLWLSVYETGGRLGDYSFNKIIAYYIVIAYLHLTVSEGVTMGFQMVEDIKDGKITPYLLKPYSYLLSEFWNLLGRSIVNHIFVIPAVLIGISISGLWHTLPPLRILGMFFLFSAIALVFYYLIYALAALSSLWVERGSHFIFGTIIISNFLNGALIPLDIFPEWFLRVSQYLPFKFLMFTPVQVFLNRISDLPKELLYASVWLAILAGILFAVWHRGIKRFESIGI